MSQKLIIKIQYVSKAPRENSLHFQVPGEDRLIKMLVCTCWKVKKVNKCVLYSWTKFLSYQIQKKLTKLKVSPEKSLATLNSCVRKTYFKARGITMEIFELQDCRWSFLRLARLDSKSLAHISVKAKVYTETFPELREGMFTFTGNYRLFTEQTKEKKEQDLSLRVRELTWQRWRIWSDCTIHPI